MFRELQRRAAMADRKIGFSQWDFAALLEGSFERTWVHVVNQKVWPGPDLNILHLCTKLVGILQGRSHSSATD